MSAKTAPIHASFTNCVTLLFMIDENKTVMLRNKYFGFN